MDKDMAVEIYKAFERLEAPVELLSIIGSIDDTLSDSECLELLRQYNKSGNYMADRTKAN